jgi:hypothetical protein
VHFFLFFYFNINKQLSYISDFSFMLQTFLLCFILVILTSKFGVV